MKVREGREREMKVGGEGEESNMLSRPLVVL